MKTNKFDFRTFLKKYGTISILIIMCVALTIISPRFLQVRNLMNIVKQIFIYAIIGCGMTMVVITSGIDLSASAMVAVSSMAVGTFAVKMGLPMIVAINNIRRISVSPWADVASMRDQIGMKAIFSCKPNPSYVTSGWDEDFMRDYTMKLLQDGKGTPFEIILKDTHTIQNDPIRLRKWTDLCRECIAKVYG